MTLVQMHKATTMRSYESGVHEDLNLHKLYSDEMPSQTNQESGRN